MKQLLMLMLLASAQESSPAYKRPIDTTSYSRARAWGTHAIIDLSHCSYYSIRSTWDLETFVERVCSFIGVTISQAPLVAYHHSGYGYTSGYTITQHANGHTDITVRVNEETNSVYIDVFSCRSFDAHNLADLAQDYFKAHQASIDILYRQ